MAKGRQSLGTLAKGWVEDTNAQVARELGILQEAMLERVDRLGADLASASHEELAEVEGVQAYAESFLVDAGQLLELLATRLDSGLEERLEELLDRAESAGEAGVEARFAVARWRRDARHYLTFVAQYVAGYIQGGGVALSLLLEMPEGPIERAVLTSIVRHRLLFAADRAELAATRWAEEVGAELIEVARQLDGDVAPAAPSPPPQETFDLFGGEPAAAPAESEADRLQRLLGMAADLNVKVKKVPQSPSHAWLDKMEAQLDAVAEKRRAQADTISARKGRLDELMAFAGVLKVKLKKVPDSPSDVWLDKVEEKLVEVAEKRGVPIPSSFSPDDAGRQATGDPAPERHEPPPPPAAEEVPAEEAPAEEAAGLPPAAWESGAAAEEDDEEEATSDFAPERYDDDIEAGALVAEPVHDTSDFPPERDAEPSRFSAEERRARIDEMLQKAEKAGLELGKLPEDPTDAWIESTEQRLEVALEKRKAERKAAREKKKRERDARIARLTNDAKELGIDLGPVPKFPTEDWLSRVEMKVASMRLPEEDEQSGDDRAARLARILEQAASADVELGEVPPDPDNLWLTWAEGRLNDSEESDELIAAGEDPEEVAAARPRIVFEEGTVQERVWVMEEAEFTIGRARGNHIQIRDDRGVSRLHATIFERDGAYFVRDNGSTKGTLVDGHLVVDDQMVRSGSRITLGDTEMVFRL